MSIDYFQLNHHQDTIFKSYLNVIYLIFFIIKPSLWIFNFPLKTNDLLLPCGEQKLSFKIFSVRKEN